MRLYNGCPDDELAAIMRQNTADRKEARDLGYCITYFPVEEKYAAARLSDWLPVGPYCHSIRGSLLHVREHAKKEGVVV